MIIKRLLQVILSIVTVAYASSALAISHQDFSVLYEGSKKAIDILGTKVDLKTDYIVFLGQSPTFINVTMSQLGFDNITTVPFSGLRTQDSVLKILNTPELKAKAWTNIERFLPSHDKIKTFSQIVVVDIAMTGISIENFTILLGTYLKENNISLKIKMLDIAPTTYAAIPLQKIDNELGKIRKLLAEEGTDRYSQHGMFYIEHSEVPDKPNRREFDFMSSVVRKMMEQDPWTEATRKNYSVTPPEQKKILIDDTLIQQEPTYLLSILSPEDKAIAEKLFQDSRYSGQFMAAIDRNLDIWIQDIEFFKKLIPYRVKEPTTDFFRQMIAHFLHSERAAVDPNYLVKILEFRNAVRDVLKQDPLEATSYRDFLWTRNNPPHLMKVLELAQKQNVGNDLRGEKQQLALRLSEFLVRSGHIKRQAVPSRAGAVSCETVLMSQ